MRATWLGSWAVIRCAAPPALRRMAATAIGLGLVAGLVGGRHGLGAREAAGMIDGGAGPRAVAFALWLAATAPAARGLPETAGLRWLRGLGVARTSEQAAVAALLAVIHAPVLALFAALAWPHGLAMWSGAIGLGAATAAIGRGRGVGPLAVVALAGALAGALVAGSPSTTAALGVVTAAVSLRVAARHATARGGRGAALVGGGPLTALVLLHATRMWRSDRGAIVRALGVAALGALLARAIVEARDLAGAPAIELSLAIGALALAAAAVAPALALAESGRAASWMIDGAGRADRARLAAGLVALALGGGLGGGFGAVATGAPLGTLTAGMTGAGLALFALGVARGRRATGRAAIDGSWLALAMCGLAGAGVLAVSLLGAHGATAVLVAGGLRALGRPER